MPEKSQPHPSYFTNSAQQKLAYHQHKGEKTGIVFLGGFRSDMNGSKALFLEEYCKTHGYSFVRFDYSGHGESDGKFEDGCIGSWLTDSLDILDNLTTDKQLIIGSSMGGWLMLLLSLKRPERIAALIGIAAAPDFTNLLMWPALSDAQKQEILEQGIAHIPSEYGDDLPLTAQLFEDGAHRILLDKDIIIDRPVHLLHGMQDADVPWRIALDISKQLTSDRVTTHLIKDGDHRLSRPQDLALLADSIQQLLN